MLAAIFFEDTGSAQMQDNMRNFVGSLESSCRRIEEHILYLGRRLDA